MSMYGKNHYNKKFFKKISAYTELTFQWGRWIIKLEKKQKVYVQRAKEFFLKNQGRENRSV